MNGTMKQTYYKPLCEKYNKFESFECDRREEEKTEENYGLSAFSMMAVAGGLLMCVGMIVYALLTM